MKWLVQGHSLKQQGQAGTQDCLTPEPARPTHSTPRCQGWRGWGWHLALGSLGASRASQPAPISQTGVVGINSCTGWSPRCFGSKQEDLKLIFFSLLKSKCYKEFLTTCGSCLRLHNGLDIPYSRGLSQTREPQSNSNLCFRWGSRTKHRWSL